MYPSLLPSKIAMIATCEDDELLVRVSRFVKSWECGRKVPFCTIEKGSPRCWTTRSSFVTNMRWISTIWIILPASLRQIFPRSGSTFAWGRIDKKNHCTFFSSYGNRPDIRAQIFVAVAPKYVSAIEAWRVIYRYPPKYYQRTVMSGPFPPGRMLRWEYCPLRPNYKGWCLRRWSPAGTVRAQKGLMQLIEHRLELLLVSVIVFEDCTRVEALKY